MVLVLLSLFIAACNPFDNSSSSSDENFLNPSESAPFIETIDNQIINQGASSAPIEFKFYDFNSKLTCSNIQISSSDDSLVKAANVVIGGQLPRCTIQFKAEASVTGKITVKLIATNGIKNTELSFDITVIDALALDSGAYQYGDGKIAKDCLEYRQADQYDGEGDGIYRIDPDGNGSDLAISVFCDMTTQGGGWTLAIKYDRAAATGARFSLDANSGRSFINPSGLQSLNSSGQLTSSLNLIPIVQNGGTMLMHVGKNDDGVETSSSYNRVYFSEIYQDVLDNPTNLFDPNLDTNSNENLAGTVVNGTSAARKDRWFEGDMTVMTIFDADNNPATDYRLEGGEGQAMWTNGKREGAVYSSGNDSAGDGNLNPKVQWGFLGKDGSAQSYTGTIFIGTYCKSDLAECIPESRMNLMFIR